MCVVNSEIALLLRLWLTSLSCIFLSGDEIDGVFLSVSGGIDRALQYATSWLDSARFIATYIEKRTAFGEFG